jgi:hypothetical protein
VSAPQLVAIETAARADARRAESFAKYAQLAQTIVIPALIVALAWYREPILAVSGNLFLMPLGVLVIAQVSLFFVTNSAKQSVQDLYFHAKDLGAKISTLETEQVRLLERAGIFLFIDNYAETYCKTLLAYKGQGVKTKEEFLRVVENVLDPLVENGEAIFGFGPSEKWNFVVYIFDSDKNVLVPLWREKSRTHPATGNGRAWGRGQGHVGYAFANQRAIITEDCRRDDVRNLVNAQGNLAQEYDVNTYVSFASVPFGSREPGRDPIGVLVATSDRPGRFTRDNSRLIVHAAVALANVLGVTDCDIRAVIRSSGETT